MYKVSVVIPIYNVEKYLGELIESLMNQTLANIQIILVDDGSPDNSGKICDEYAQKDERITVIHKKNAGVGAARNDGLKVANGEWIIFCDSDDWLELDALETLVNAAEECGADIALGDANLAYSTKVRKSQLYKESFIADNREKIDRMISAVMSRNYCDNPPAEGPGNGGYGGPWNKLVKRQLIMDNQITFDLTVKGNFDDILYIANVYANASKIVYVNKPVYNYRQLENSIAHSVSFKQNMLEINRAIFEAWQKFMEEYGKDGRYTKPYYANVMRRFKATLGPYFFNAKNPKGFSEQLKELKALMKQEPYASAIRDAEGDKLHNKYDLMVWKAARRNSAMQIYLIYKISIIAKVLRKKKNS